MNRRIAFLALLTPLVTLPQQEPQPRVVDPGSTTKAPSDAVVLFDGTDMSHWTTEDGKPARCTVVSGAMLCRTGAGNIFSTEKFRSAQIHVEFSPPPMPDQTSQNRGNSGVYLQGRYEIQILDSYRNPTYPTGVLGALYGQAAPLVNPARPPGEWQTYDIIFHAPRCDASGGLAERGSVTVLLNGVLVQDHVTIQDIGSKGCAAEHLGDPGPLMLQDHNYTGAPVTDMRFRNVWFRRLD